MLYTVFLSSLFLPAVTSDDFRCFACIGNDCEDQHCQGDYCVIANYTAKFGFNLTEESQVVKGCASGSMLESDIREHCEIHNTEHGKQNSMCVCNSRECYAAQYLNQVMTETVMFTCSCSGVHCGNATSCRGEMCTWAKNHQSGIIERGCHNSTFPLLERRAIGSCMIPPMTDSLAMSVAKNTNDLLVTESCICAKDYCNKENPSIPKIKTPTRFCNGEYCFTATLRSDIGLLHGHFTVGCVTFLPDSVLAEEFKPSGCVQFESRKLSIQTCFVTRDKEALKRAHNRKAISAAPQNNSALNETESSAFTGIHLAEASQETTSMSTTTTPYIYANDVEVLNETEPSVSKEVSQETSSTLTKSAHYIQADDSESSDNQSLVVATTILVLLILSLAVAAIMFKLKLHHRLSEPTHNTVSASYRRRFTPLS